MKLKTMVEVGDLVVLFLGGTKNLLQEGDYEIPTEQIEKYSQAIDDVLFLLQKRREKELTIMEGMK